MSEHEHPTEPPTLRERLRAVPTIDGDYPAFDPDAAPAEPFALAVEWLLSAVDAGVNQPLAMTLATVDAELRPNARTLLLKDVADGALWFASMDDGPKGAELAAHPDAAVVLFWREQGRQVRARGRVEKGSRAVSEQDFLVRHPAARVGAIAGVQSAPLPERGEVDAARAGAAELVASIPGFVPPAWAAYRLVPWEIEFWQAAAGREQIRLRYRRSGDDWAREQLWP
jgi:pyridoxamine 5'-phosphate oxidase